MGRMHDGEFEVDEALVRRLLADQFPEWSDLPLRLVEPMGTANAIFRLGDALSVRLPRRDGPSDPGAKEFEWLPRLAPLLPVEIPVPLAQGVPTATYPWFWAIHSLVEGDTVPVAEIDAVQAARDLAAFVRAMQQLDPTGAPPGRGIALAERDPELRVWLERFEGDPIVTTEWERALAAPPWHGAPVWHHGDPARDVMVAWKLHSPEARDVFREAVAIDDATWERGRGWVVSQAVAILAYYTPANNSTLYHEAEAWLELLLSEERS